MRASPIRALQVRTADRLRASLARNEVSGLLVIDQLSQADQRELCEVGGGRLAALVIRVDAPAWDDQMVVLREVARVVQEHVRRTDLLGAIAVDSLLILSPGLEPAGGRRLAERIATLFASRQFEVDSRVVEIRVKVGLAYRSAASPSGWNASTLAAEAELQSSEPFTLSATG
jgi:hypothetical protein